MFNQSKMFTGLWFIEQLKHIIRQSANWIHVNLGGWARYGTAQAWLTFCHAPLISSPKLISDLSSRFHSLANNLRIGLSSNLVGALIVGFPRTDRVLVIVCHIWPPPHHTLIFPTCEDSAPIDTLFMYQLPNKHNRHHVRHVFMK